MDIFLTFAQNIDCGYTLETPREGGCNEYPQSMSSTHNLCFGGKIGIPLHIPVFLYMWFMGNTFHGHDRASLTQVT